MQTSFLYAHIKWNTLLDIIHIYMAENNQYAFTRNNKITCSLRERKLNCFPTASVYIYTSWMPACGKMWYGGSYSEVKCGVLFQIKRAAPRHCVISRWARKGRHHQPPRARMRGSCRHPRRSLNPKNVFGRYPQYILHSYARRVHSVLKARWTTFDGNNGLIVTAGSR